MSLQGSAIYIIDENHIAGNIIVNNGKNLYNRPENQDGVFSGSDISNSTITGLYDGRLDDYLYYPYD